ncbi:MAG: hypothetical protein N3A38_09770 [Planctomycetota bacterium]|nr:hypothetical protein [Planctomycetota bacterium]
MALPLISGRNRSRRRYCTPDADVGHRFYAKRRLPSATAPPPVTALLPVAALLSVAIGAACASRPAAAGDLRAEFARWEAEADVALGRKPSPPAAEKPKPPDPPPPGACQTCRDTGKYPCPNHQKQTAFWTEGQQPPACCGGLGWIACPRCPREKQQANADEWKGAVESRKALFQELGKFRELTGLKLQVSIAPRIAFVSDLSPQSCARSAQHCHELLLKFRNVFGCERFEFTEAEDTRFFIFQKHEGYLAFLDKAYKEMFPDADIDLCRKAMGFHHSKEPSMSIGDYSKMRTQNAMDHHVVHVYAHFLLARIGGFKKLPIWLEEGFAAWCETLQLRQPETYCFAYELKDVDIGANRRRFLQEGIKKNRLCQLPTLDRLTLDGYELMHYFMSWSLVEMLMRRDPAKFLTFVEVRKDTDDTEEALKKAFGYDWPKLYEVWKRYVLAGN